MHFLSLISLWIELCHHTLKAFKRLLVWLNMVVLNIVIWEHIELFWYACPVIVRSCILLPYLVNVVHLHKRIDILANSVHIYISKCNNVSLTLRVE
jgi:hypothetical protein